MHNACMCGPWNGTMAILMPLLSIANCGHPEVLFTASNESVPKVFVNTVDFIPVEGSTVVFSCPPGFELIGPDTAICTENGKWEPDPGALICNYSSSQGNTVHVHYNIIQVNCLPYSESSTHTCY